MSKEIYKQSLEVMQKRGGGYSGMDIPEFYAMMEGLFTPEQAEINNNLPGKPATAKEIAGSMGRDELETEKILESMADNGLCGANEKDGAVYYRSAPFMPGILEYQFMRGTTTDRDKEIARLIDSYKKAHDTVRPPASRKITFAPMRVIPVDKMIADENTIHTYDQVQTYIEKNDSIAVGACYCRHKAELLGEDTHGMPTQVCMSFGRGAEFVSERLGGRKLTKEEARKVIDQTEEAGLVHMSRNTTDNIDFICNCDRWHCGAIEGMLEQSKPGQFFNSGFEPQFDPEECTACETCIERCPPEALALGEDDVPEVDLDRCFGCAVCATGCPSEAITMVSKPGFQEPPKDGKALGEAIKASYA